MRPRTEPDTTPARQRTQNRAGAGPGSRSRVPLTMVLPPLALLAIGLGLGLAPGLEAQAAAAAAAFSDRAVYAATVLGTHGGPCPRAARSSPRLPARCPWAAC